MNLNDPALNSDGFSLVEAMIALLILTIGWLAVATMLNTAMWNDRYNAQTRFAHNAASSKMEDIKSSGAANYPEKGSERLQNPGNWNASPEGWISREWEIHPDELSGLKKITVTVKWGKYAFNQVSYAK